MSAHAFDTAAVKSWLLDLQARIVAALETADGQPFRTDAWERPEGGAGVSRLIEEGNVLERGGVFFDDFAEGGFEHAFAMTRSVGDAFLAAYLPILQRRKDIEFGERERYFQACRRGRYVEFNLVYDRGTLFGLQSGGRTESILMSLPPIVKWRYDWHPAPGTAEARLYSDFLVARAWT